MSETHKEPMTLAEIYRAMARHHAGLAEAYKQLQRVAQEGSKPELKNV